MNKKVIIITVSIIVALAILVGSCIAIFNSLYSESSHEHDGQSSLTSGENSAVENSDSKTESGSVSSGDTNNDNTPSQNDNQDNSTTSVPKATKDMTTFIAGDVTAKIGDKVTVPIYVSNNKGFMGLMAKFEYDTSALKYTGYKKGDVLTDYEVPTKNGVIGLQSVENGDVKKDGVIIYLQFDVIAKNPTTTQININIGEHDVGNYSMQYVETDTINGNVTIK